MNKQSKQAGVYWNKKSNKWQSDITVSGEKIYLGRFDCELNAIKARLSAEVKYNKVDKRATSYISGGVGYIALSQGKFALVDKCDFDKINKYKWSAYCDKGTNSYYATRNSRRVEDKKRTTIHMHRYVMNAPSEVVVDHKYHNTLDNRKGNLRLSTHSQNSMNKRRAKNNKSGFTGVGFNKRSGKWVARITVNLKRISLGCFVLKSNAVKARKQAEVKYFGKYTYKRG